jgi:hypothetical protein
LFLIGELLTFEIMKTACHAFEANEIIFYSVDRSTKRQRHMIHLSPKYESAKELRNLANNILHFVTY